MDAEVSPPESRWRGPWFPVTIGQVAAFAHAATGRLLIMTALAALLLAVAVTEVARTAWLPVIELSIRQLPAGQAELRDRRLIWPDDRIQTLGNNGLLAVIVNPANRPLDDQGPDIQVELAGDRVIFGWLFGYASLPYPPMPALALSPEELRPLLGAWRPHLLAGAGLAVFLGALAFWFAWGMLGAIPLRLGAAALGRVATLTGCWRSSVAAWLPGTLPFTVALVFYQHRMISLAGVLGVGALAILLSLVLLLAVPFLLPRAAARSPFDEVADEPAPAAHAPAANPFVAGEPLPARPGNEAVPASEPGPPTPATPVSPASPADGGTAEEPLNPS